MSKKSKNTGPRIVCSGCGEPIRIIEIPLCNECCNNVDLIDDANREMGLPEGEDWGNK